MGVGAGGFGVGDGDSVGKGKVGGGVTVAVGATVAIGVGMGRGVGFGFGVRAAGGGVAVATRRAGRVGDKTAGVAVGKGKDTGSGKGDGIKESGAADVAAGSAYRSSGGPESQAAGSNAAVKSATGSSRRYQHFPVKLAIAHPIVAAPALVSAQTGAANLPNARTML